MRCRTGLAVGVGLACLGVAGSASALQISAPRDGATVREKVKIIVPRTNLPPSGFLALYIDNEFIVAQSPAVNQSGPMVFTWDTKLPRGKIGLTSEQRDFADGEHVLEVRSYNQEGAMVERDQVSVLLNNRVPSASRQPVRLSYKFRPDEKVTYQLRTEVEATQTGTSGGAATYPAAGGGYPGGGYSGGYPGPGGAGVSGGASPGIPPGAESGPGGPGFPGAGGPGYNPNSANGTQTYTEFRKVSVHVADDAGEMSLLREFPENPLTIIVNGAKQPVTLPAVSRYYFLNAQGDDKETAAMIRQNQKPIYNVIRLPAHSVRVGEEFKARLNISLGAYIPERIEVTATNVVEAIEWELGSPSARIRSTYTWNGKLSIPALGINEADCKLKGTSVIHFAPATGQPVRAVHNLDGDVIVDLSRPQSQGTSGGIGAPGLGGPGLGGPAMFPGAPGGEAGKGPGGLAPGGYPGGAGGYGGGTSLTPQTATYKAKIRATLTAQR